MPGTPDVCYPPTRFAWNNELDNDFPQGYFAPATSRGYSNLLNFAVDFKIGDINGDGRQDLVYIKDRNCNGNAGDRDLNANSFTRFRFMVATGDDTGLEPSTNSDVFPRRNPASTLVPIPSCQDNGPATNFDANSPIRWDLIWHLFDVTGDGRDDLIVQIPKPATCTSCTGWFLYPAVQVAGKWTFSSTGTDLAINSNFDQDSNFTDLTGDGLPDLVFGNPQLGVSVRALERDPGANNPAFKFESATRTITFVGFEEQSTLAFGTSERDSLRSGDLNGDGIGDFLLRVSKIRSGVQCNGGSCGPCGASGQPNCEPDLLAACPTGQNSCIVPRPNPLSLGTGPRWQNASDIDAERAAPLRSLISQADYWVTAKVEQVGSNFVVTAGQCVGPGANPAFCDDVGGNLLSASLADINSDGVADVFMRYRQSGNGSSRIDRFAYRINKGGNSLTGNLLAEQNTGLTLPRIQADRLQLADVNGDKRADLVYQILCTSNCSATGTNPLKMRRFLTTGFAAEESALTGSAAVLGNQDPNRYLVLPMDINGDGSVDLVRYKADNSSSQNMYVVPSNLRYGGNDYIVQFTNGFNVSHKVNYAPLVSKFTYERAFDGPLKNWGRNSVVFDVFTPLWAVREAYSSSPGCAPDATTCNFGVSELTATSNVRYSYQGARVQTGGRGFLGFASIRTEDIQNKLLTTTEYRQDYPYIGRPSRTIVQKLTSVIVDPCLSNPLDPICFVEPPDDCGGGICPRPNARQNLRAANLAGQPYRFMSTADPIITDTSTEILTQVGTAFWSKSVQGSDRTRYSYPQ